MLENISEKVIFELSRSNIEHIALEVIFKPEIAPYSITPNQDEDIVLNSAVNFYGEGVTDRDVNILHYLKSSLGNEESSLLTQRLNRIFDTTVDYEVLKTSFTSIGEFFTASLGKLKNKELSIEDLEFIERLKKSESDITKIDLPQFGFNTTIYKDKSGNLYDETWFAEGKYGSSIKKIIKELELAIPFSENEKQAHSIQTLVDFYKSGDPADFDKHSLAWVKDDESLVYFLNGFIESYADPKGIRCTYESLVAIRDEEKTARISLLAEDAQWFEDRLPTDERFRKKVAKGLSASASLVVSMSGDCAPQLPLGICLPNSDWIREKHGSKSVVLSNVSKTGDSEHKMANEFFLTKDDAEKFVKYDNLTGNLHTDLHEVLGHGSGRNLDGISNDVLDDYYSIIEETRADLVGLFFVYDQKMIDLGLLDTLDASREQYLSYLTNGLMLQLKKVELGKPLAQTHMRNRQLVTKWVIEKGSDKNVVEVVKESGKTYIKINDYDELKVLFGSLLAEIQRIKSEGDYEAAKLIVNTYGTNIDIDLHTEVLARYEELDVDAFFGFVVPVYTQVYEDGVVTDVTIRNPETFIEDQLYQSNNFK